MTKRTRSNHRSHLLGQWQRFAVPQLMIESEQDDQINIFGPIANQETADFWQWWFESDYLTTDVEFQKALSASPAQHVKLLINSPGGDVFAGSAIRSFIQSEQAKGRTFEAHIVGMAASAAAFVAVAANRVVIADMGMFMIHRSSVGYDAWGYGNEDDLQIVINDLEARKRSLKEIDEAQLKIFMDKTGKPRQEMRELVRRETYFNADSAVEEGFVDQVQSSGVALDPIQDKQVPQGFHRTAAGGFAHQAPAFAFAAAQGLGSQKDDDLPHILTIHPQVQETQVVQEGPNDLSPKGVTSMYESQIRLALGLAASVELTDQHRDQYIGMLMEKNKELGNENEQLRKEKADAEQKACASSMKTFFDKQVARGAMTPAAAASVQSQLLLAQDPEQQFEIQKSIFEALPDGDDGGATARQAKGEGKVADGLDGNDSERQLARQFYDHVNKLVKEEGLSVGAAQDRAIADLSDEHLDAYMNGGYDFDDNQKPSEED